MTSSVDLSPLDDPFTEALLGRQSHFARRRGRIVAFDPEVSVFYGHPRRLTNDDWADLAALAGPGNTVGLRDCRTPLPAGWQHLETFDLVQYSGEMVVGHEPRPADRHIPDPGFTVLGVDDVPEMTALVELTKPGPFLPRTIETGVYLGYRDCDGRLLAMAGQRLHLPGWVEISAVCTHPDARGRGLARALPIGGADAREGRVFGVGIDQNARHAIGEQWGKDAVVEAWCDDEQAVRAGAYGGLETILLELGIRSGKEDAHLMVVGVELIHQAGTDRADVLVVKGVNEEGNVMDATTAAAVATASVTEFRGDTSDAFAGTGRDVGPAIQGA